MLLTHGLLEDVGGAAGQRLGALGLAARAVDAGEQVEALGEVGVLLAEDFAADVLRALGFNYFGVGRGYAAQPFPAEAEDLYSDSNGGI